MEHHNKIKITTPFPGFLTLDFFNWFIEKFILFRFDWVKMMARTNLNILKAAWMGILIPCFFTYIATLLFDNISLSSIAEISNNDNQLVYKPVLIFKDYKFYTAIITAFSVIYWNIGQFSMKKWLYCADLYNQMNQTPEKWKRNNILSSLCIDLIRMDLWAHESYSSLFKRQFKDAVKFYKETPPKDDEDDIYKVNISKIEIKLKNGWIEEKDATKLLEYYQCKNIKYHDKDETKDGKEEQKKI